MVANYSQQQLRDYWLEQAAKLTRRVKFAAALETYLPLLFCLTLPLAAAIILCRTANLPLWWSPAALAIIALSSLPIAIWHAWRHPFDTIHALARIENRLRIHSALTSAYEGATPWPPPYKTEPAQPRWQWRRLANEPSLITILLLLAFLIPLPAPLKDFFIQREPPPALNTVNQWLEQLEKTATTEPEALEQLRQQVRDILRRPEARWYEHASLEAADHIRTSTQTAIAELNEALTLATAAIENAATLSSLTPTQLLELQQHLDRAYDTFKSGPLPLNQNLRQALHGLQLSELQSLPPEKLQQLLDQLRQHQQTCQNTGACSGEKQTTTQFPGQNNSQHLAQSEGDGEGQGKNDTVLLIDNTTGPDPGQGGIDRGGSSAPLAYNILPTQLHTTNLNTLPPADLSRAQLGDLTQITTRAPEPAPPPDTTATGGTARTHSRGQSATYREEYSPEERAILQAYYQ
jgi:hypothetical protein